MKNQLLKALKWIEKRSMKIRWVHVGLKVVALVYILTNKDRRLYFCADLNNNLEPTRIKRICK